MVLHYEIPIHSPNTPGASSSRRDRSPYRGNAPSGRDGDRHRDHSPHRSRDSRDDYRYVLKFNGLILSLVF